MRKQISSRETTALVVVFSLSRLAYRAAGVRFDTTPLAYYWQYLDPALLRAELGASLVALHSQPPVFNLFLGLVSQLPEAWQTPTFAATFLGLGLAAAIAMLALLARLGVGPRGRWGLTLVFVLSPAAVLYENQLFYPLPIAALLVLAARALQRFGTNDRAGDAVAFFSLLALVCLTASLFHLGWLILLAALLLPTIGAGRSRRIFALAALAPIVVVALVYAHRAARFGTFSTSSWMGMSLARVATSLTPLDERRAIAETHPELALLARPPFSPPDAYGEWLRGAPATGVAALDQTTKSTGAPNYNHSLYLRVSAAYLAATRAWILRFPDRYVEGVGAAHMLYLRGAADSNWLGDNRRRLGPFVPAWDLVMSGQLRPFDNRLGPGAVAWWWALGLPVLLIVATRKIAKRLPHELSAAPGPIRHAPAARSPDAAPDTPPDAARGNLSLAVYLLATVVWVAVVGNWLELGENNRFRFLTEPLVWLLTGWVCATRENAPPAAR